MEVEEHSALLDLAGIHGDALVTALRASDSEDGGRIARRGADFLRESLSTFEIALRGYAEMREVARTTSAGPSAVRRRCSWVGSWGTGCLP
jgi:hypothetical protein